MNPGIFEILKNVPAVTALLGTSPFKFYNFSEAPDKTPAPYATYGIYNGLPENTLDKAPEIDNDGTQINIWAQTGKSCVDVFVAIRDALEPYGHMTSYDAATRDAETKLFTIRMEFDFFTPR